MMSTLPPFLRKTTPKEKPYDKNSTSYLGKDSREGRLKPIKTAKGNFTFKDNRKGE